MRILVTGATGFVGSWLVPELEAHGHEVIRAPASRDLSITDEAHVREFVGENRPDAIVHLAGMAFAGDASRDPGEAIRVNEGGTRTVIGAAAAFGCIPTMIAGSADVYGNPDPADLPLRESAPLLATQPYGKSKLAQERAALELSRDLAVPVVVTRSFNHTGPGQRHEFVAPALASRLLQAKRDGTGRVAVGNLVARRDLGDVRDVVRAYRLLLDALVGGGVESGTVVNVATGRTISVRELFDLIADAIDTSAVPVVAPELVRQDDPPVLVGDATRLRKATGWEPRIAIETTVRDVVESLARS